MRNRHHEPERTLDDALKDLEALLSEGKRREHHRAYLNRSLAFMRAKPQPLSAADARIMLDLERRLAALDAQPVAA